MATTNDLKNGMVLNLDGQLWSVVEFQHVKPGKGGAFVRTTLKNVLSGKVVDKTFNAGTKVDTATVDKRTMQYLYTDGEDFVFMDLDTYDQIRSRRHRRRRRQLPAARGGGDRRHARGRAALRRAARQRGAGGHLHRAGPAGRPLHRRHQAGHAWRPARRSRSRCSSPPARRSRSTPATAATSAAPELAEVPKTQMPARRKARKRALGRPLRGRPARPPPARGAGRATSSASSSRSPPHLDYTISLVEGVGRAPRPDRRADRELRRGLDARADAGGRPQPAADRRLRAAVRRRHRRRGRDHEAVELAKRCPPTTRPASSTASRRRRIGSSPVTR